IKLRFEKSLQKKAARQLVGVLPAGGFKLSVLSDIGPLANGEVLDIKRMFISVVIDMNNEEIYLDQSLKTQIFSTVAGAVGYIRGRDSIILNKADFSLLSDEEKKELQRQKTMAKIKGWFFKSLYVFGPLLFLGLLYYLFKKLRKTPTSAQPDIVKTDIERAEDLTDIKDELAEETKINQIKETADQSPELLANIMKDWLKTEKEEVLT
ncbi:hypothetical protein ACFLZV_04245, partial [Candidatus Margulisiibacteriota bacterium]